MSDKKPTNEKADKTPQEQLSQASKDFDVPASDNPDVQPFQDTQAPTLESKIAPEDQQFQHEQGGVNIEAMIQSAVAHALDAQAQAQRERANAAGASPN